MTKRIIKLIAWLFLLGSGFYLTAHFGATTAIAILLNFASFYLIMWISDRDNGGLL